MEEEAKEKDNNFLEILDSMIESTEEFIRDDGLEEDNWTRVKDLAALVYVRDLFTEVYMVKDD